MSPGRRLRVHVLRDRSRACGRILDYVGHRCIDRRGRRRPWSFWCTLATSWPAR